MTKQFSNVDDLIINVCIIVSTDLSEHDFRFLFYPTATKAKKTIIVLENYLRYVYRTAETTEPILIIKVSMDLCICLKWYKFYQEFLRSSVILFKIFRFILNVFDVGAISNTVKGFDYLPLSTTLLKNAFLSDQLIFSRVKIDKVRKTGYNVRDIFGHILDYCFLPSKARYSSLNSLVLLRRSFKRQLRTTL